MKNYSAQQLIKDIIAGVIVAIIARIRDRSCCGTLGSDRCRSRRIRILLQDRDREERRNEGRGRLMKTC